MKIFTKLFVVILTISTIFGFTGPGTAHAATSPNLGVADNYAVFGKLGVTNDSDVGTTSIWGNVGADLDTDITNLSVSQVGGTIIAPAVGVQTAASAAYDELDLGTQGIPTALDLAGANSVGPGVYTVGATTLDGTLTLDGAGVYIFRSSSSISTSGAGTMSLINGATACNVFWEIPASMTIGTGAHIEGTIIAQTGLISLATGATLKGRALSLISQVTMDSNQITEPTCPTRNGTITVIKIVTNDDGGNQTIADFPLFVGSTSVVSGVAQNFAVGTYAVTETTNSNYAQAFTGDCDTNGNITVAVDEQLICTITNNDIRASSGGGSGGSRGPRIIPPLAPPPGLLFPRLTPTVLGASTTLPANLPVTGISLSPIIILLSFAVGTVWIKRKQLF